MANGQRFDEFGKPISAPATPAGQRFDETGKPIASPGAAPSTTSSTTAAPTLADKTLPFGKDVATGMGFDVDKMERMEKDPSGGRHPIMGALEAARQMMQAAGPWIDRTLKDPAHIIDPLNQLASGVTKAAGLPDTSDKSIFSKSSYQKPNPGQLLGATSMIAGGADKLSPEVAARIAERQIAVNHGYVGLGKSVQNEVVKAQNNIVGKNGAIGRHAQAVIEQSAADAQRKQLPGEISGAEAQLAGSARAAVVKRPDYTPSHPTWYTLADAKDTLSRLGQQASKLDRGGKSPEASVLWAEYDALRKPTQARADTLGSDFGRSWKYYSDEFHKFVQVQKGLLGDILEAQTNDDHIASVKQMTGGEPPAKTSMPSKVHPDLNAMKKWIKTYGGDPAVVDMAVEQGQTLNKLTQQSKSLFVSRLRGLYNHPVLSGVPGVAALAAGHALAGPIGGLVTSMLIVGHVSGLLDARETISLLKEIRDRVGPENMDVAPKPQGEPPMPRGGAGPSAPQPTGPQPPSGTVGGGIGESELEMERRRPSGTPAPTETVGETTGPDLNQKLAEQADLAQKLQHARKGRK